MGRMTVINITSSSHHRSGIEPQDDALGWGVALAVGWPRALGTIIASPHEPAREANCPGDE